MEGLGPIRPSARGNTIPGEERGAEVNKSIKAFILLAILFCYRLSYTQPFRNSVVEGDGVYTGEDPILVKNGKTLEHFSSQETIRGDLSGGGWGARAASGNLQTSVCFFAFDPMINRITIESNCRTHLGDGNVQKICLMPTFGLVSWKHLDKW